MMNKLVIDARENSELSDLVETYCKEMNIPYEKEWLDIGMEKVIEFASLNNCEHLEGYGRKAWGRALSKYGFYPEYIAFRMEIENG